MENSMLIQEHTLIENQYRSIYIGNISNNMIGENITISGWIYHKRDHGGVMFVDLRDRTGIIQTVCDIKNKSVFDILDRIRVESVITITGIISQRSKDNVNASIKNGEIEINIETINLESEAEALPIQLNGDKNPEELRLKYRFLDLRTPKMLHNILLRSAVIQEIRSFMINSGFIEIQTPILTSSSPEGARDYIVPSRIHKGKFYALPQAPQIFKQILMVAGFDKYFQIAPCFRDEDSRADRSPGEFYQLDVEMSFVTQDDIFNIFEPLMKHIFKKYAPNKKVHPDFEKITFNDAMNLYGSDKPDLRNPLIISDVTEIFRDSEFSIFKNNIKKGMIVKAIPAPKTGNSSRSFFDKKIEYAIQELKSGGLGYINFNENNEAKGPIAKFLTEEQISQIQTISDISAGDSIFFVSNTHLKACKIAGHIRKLLGEELGLIEENIFKFCWIIDFPFFEYDEEHKKIDFSHNPFSMPQGGIETLNNKDPLEILAYQYDIVCNGIELSSGAIRNHKLDIMFKAFEIVGYTKDVVEQKFPSLTNAFKYGAPPHGGLAPGIDRILMLITGEENIREVICFPMNQKCEDTMCMAPSIASPKHLKELGIELTKELKKI